MINVLKLNSSIIFAFVLSAVLFLSVAVALPVGAQQIEENCTLSRNVSIKVGTLTVIDKDSVVGSTNVLTDAKSGGVEVTDGSVDENAIVKKWGTICLINTVNTLSDWAFFILLTISFVFIAVAGFMWMTSQGDAEKQGTAGKMIAAALVGIVIAIIARMVPAVLTGVLL